MDTREGSNTMTDNPYADHRPPIDSPERVVNYWKYRGPELRADLADALARERDLRAAVEALAASNGAWKGDHHVRVEQRDSSGFTVTRSAVWVDDLRAALAAHPGPDAVPPALTDVQVQAIDDALYGAFSDCDCDHNDIREVVVQALDAHVVPTPPPCPCGRPGGHGGPCLWNIDGRTD